MLCTLLPSPLKLIKSASESTIRRDQIYLKNMKNKILVFFLQKNENVGFWIFLQNFEWMNQEIFIEWQEKFGEINMCLMFVIRFLFWDLHFTGFGVFLTVFVFFFFFFFCFTFYGFRFLFFVFRDNLFCFVLVRFSTDFFRRWINSSPFFRNKVFTKLEPFSHFPYYRLTSKI